MIKSIGPSEDQSKNSPAWKQFAWFVGLSIASGAVVAVVAYALRGLLFL